MGTKPCFINIDGIFRRFCHSVLFSVQQGTAMKFIKNKEASVMVTIYHKTGMFTLFCAVLAAILLIMPSARAETDIVKTADSSGLIRLAQGLYRPQPIGQPWRDFQVQNCGRRFLNEVVLPDWIRNHPHKNCSNIRVDEWGRLLCRYITPTTNRVDGPWENPTNYLFYAYNNFQTQQRYGITLNNYMREFCGIDLTGYR